MEFRCVPVGEMQANAYVVFQPERPDALVIDPGAEPEAIRLALEGRRLAAIVLTHGHVDHIGAVASLRGPDVPVAIHAADAAMLTHPNLSLSVMFGGAPSQGEADLRLAAGDLLLAGVPFSVLHTPGHTPGGICLRCGDDLFTGDTLFCRGYGRTDLPGGDEQALMRSLRRLLALEEGVRVHPGHGPSTTIGRERRVYGLP